MIQSFGDDVTGDFFTDGTLPAKGCGWKSLSSVAERKLDMVDAAAEPFDLREPPGNRFEKLEGLEDWFSIRINDQWRICFRWSSDDDGPELVQIVDYHD